jgi:hypothetical protein
MKALSTQRSPGKRPTRSRGSGGCPCGTSWCAGSYYSGWWKFGHNSSRETSSQSVESPDGPERNWRVIWHIRSRREQSVVSRTLRFDFLEKFFPQSGQGNISVARMRTVSSVINQFQGSYHAKDSEVGLDRHMIWKKKLDKSLIAANSF